MCKLLHFYAGTYRGLSIIGLGILLVFTFKGVKVATPTGDNLSAKAVLLQCSVDLPAHAMVLQMKQYNGICGCCYCEEEGETPPGQHLRRYWPYKHHPVPRSHDSMERDAKTALRNKIPVGLCLMLVGDSFWLLLLLHFGYAGERDERFVCLVQTSTF